MALLDCQFNVLWIVVEATDNDEVLETAGYKQLAVIDKTKIACPQKCLLARLRKGCTKRVFILFITIPVALRHTGPVHPDFSHLVRQTDRQKLRMHNPDFFVRKDAATAHHSARLSITCVCRDNTMLFERCSLKPSLSWERRRFAAAHDECRLS